MVINRNRTKVSY